MHEVRLDAVTLISGMQERAKMHIVTSDYNEYSITLAESLTGSNSCGSIVSGLRGYPALALKLRYSPSSEPPLPAAGPKWRPLSAKHLRGQCPRSDRRSCGREGEPPEYLYGCLPQV